MTTLLSLAPLPVSALGWFLTLGAAFGSSWAVLGMAIVITLGGQACTGWWHAKRGGRFPPYSPVLAALPFCGWAPAFVGDIINPTATSRGWQGLAIYLTAGAVAGGAFWLGHMLGRPCPPRLKATDSPKVR